MELKTISTIEVFFGLMDNSSENLLHLNDGIHIAILNQTYENLDISNLIFKEIEFDNCNFSNVYFGSCIFTDNTFKNCRFDKCSFGNTFFRNGSFYNSQLISSRFFNSGFDSLVFSGTIFEKSHFLDAVYFHCYHMKTRWKNSSLSQTSFISNGLNNAYTEFDFISSRLSYVHFRFMNLKESRFSQSKLMLVSFTYCILGTETISNENFCDDNGFSSLDLQTIYKSEKLNPSVLKKLFGIHEPLIKTHIEGMIKEVQFESVFISYSFNDKLIANRINESLQLKGINTFLWEKDAPGGMRLKEIMKNKIQNYDRIIFIASEDSLKSEACHFELTEGRRKQDKTWKTIFIPVHIDGFLFSIEKDQIRPKEKREEFWKNIEDIKEINSIDFSMFNKSDYDLNKFESHIEKLITIIKKKK